MVFTSGILPMSLKPVGRAAARLLRDTFFAANLDVLLQFQGDHSLAIILRRTGNQNLDFETYIGNPGDAYDNSLWVVRTDAVQGNDGAQGRFEISIHINASSTPTPATPTGGSYNIDTGVLTTPTGTTEHPTVPSAGEDVYLAEATINPEVQEGSVTPVWSAWVERAHLSSGISHVERHGGIDRKRDRLGSSRSRGLDCP